MRNLGLGSLAAVSLAWGCGGPGVTASAHAPDAFALQYVGTYSGGSAEVSTLTLHRDGTYSALVHGQTETGVFGADASGTHDLPLKFTFRDASGQWSGTIGEYDGTIQLDRDGQDVSLKAAATVGPSEDVCEDSGGEWLDDDADPSTGLFCKCPAGDAYIPSAGGCGQ